MLFRRMLISTLLIGLLVLSCRDSEAQAQSSSRNIRICYVTNRARTASQRLAYGSELGSLEFGECNVSVIDSQGTRESSSSILLLAGYATQTARKVVIQSVTPFAEGQSGPRFSRQRSKSRDVLVFVHGFNVSFADGIRQLAGLVHDLQFQGTPILFSWCSQGRFSVKDYWIDNLSLFASAPQLKHVLQNLTNDAPAGSVHVLAHSLGCRLLAGVLTSMTAERPFSEMCAFGEVILAAPDIDTHAFGAVAVSRVAQMCKRVTVFVSTNDHALQFSQQIHGQSSRLGDGGMTTQTGDGHIETIDVTNVESGFGFGHSYFSENLAVIRDIKAVLDGKSPAARGLQRHVRESASGCFWSFPKPTTPVAQRQP